MFKTICASAHNIPLPPKSIHQVITSPPYYGLRSYAGRQAIEWPTARYRPMPGLPEIEIAGCDPGCTHEWGKAIIRDKRGLDTSTSTLAGPQRADARLTESGDYCHKCGGWRGGLGQEPTIEAYIGHLILCLRNWRDLLRDDGTCFVNLGDSFANDSKWGGASGGKHVADLHGNSGIGRGKKNTGIPAKNLCLIPERFRLAAQADGWIVRSAFNWIKASALPESVTDRPSNSHESWVMLAKSQRYYWDGEAIKREAVVGYAGSTFTNGKTADAKAGLADVGQGERSNQDGANGRNRRTADWLFESIDNAIAETKRWLAHAEQVREHQGLLLDDEDHPLVMPVNPRPFTGAHFAAFPPGVVEPLISAGTSQRGCCPKCGAPWVRITQVSGKTKREMVKEKGESDYFSANGNALNYAGGHDLPERQVVTTGWEPSCQCAAGDPIPCAILDPFVGSGTSLEVATALGRHSVGVDISQDYLDNVLPIRFQDGVQIGFQF